ncbi:MULTISPECIES: TIGR02466 family protein [Burkholderia]|uniref:TIGR02466 family protein n=1 Tax=Burkholderia TaxID=32008 RepID=UPI000A94728F|nr:MULTISPECIES: TIGR02466 family protein [Burkholderia]
MFREISPSLWQCWPVFIFQQVLDDVAEINARLADEILRRASTEPSAKASNADAWQSAADFFGRGDADKTFLVERVTAAMRQMNRLSGITTEDFEVILEGWSVVNRAGHHHNHHIHHSSVWSGVYYVRTPAESASAASRDGAIEFIDPRHAAPVTARSIRTIRPVSGSLLLFPSWLEHWVHPHYEAGERISIPFNIYLMPRMT